MNYRWADCIDVFTIEFLDNRSFPRIIQTTVARKISKKAPQSVDDQEASRFACKHGKYKESQLDAAVTRDPTPKMPGIQLTPSESAFPFPFGELFSKCSTDPSSRFVYSRFEKLRGSCSSPLSTFTLWC